MAAQPGLVHDGNYLVTFVDTIVNPAVPKLTELNGASALKLECQITPDGLNREASDEMVDTSRLCSVFSTQRIGRTSFEVSLTLVRHDTSIVDVEDEAYDTLVKGKTGYLVIRDNKSASLPYAVGDEVEVYYVECGTRSKATPAANEQMTFSIPMSVMSEPELNAIAAT